MEEVEDLLKAWELQDLIPTFRRNGINIQALSSLSLDEIKEMIPLIGPRALFIRCWKTWMTDFNDLNVLNSSNITLSDIEVLPFPEIEKEEVPEILLKSSEHKENIEPYSNSILVKLLKESLEASSLLAHMGKHLPGEPARNLLASVIAKEILKANPDSSITSPIYNKWCAEIKKIYPAERITTYYIPACVTASGGTYQARGKLISQVLNTRRKYQKLGVLAVKKRNRDNGPSPSSSTSRLTIEDDNSTDDVENIEEQLLWLHHSSDPWYIVESKWKDTLRVRLQQLKNKSTEEYLSEYPSLRKPHGITLLHMDFDSGYPQNSNNLLLRFPVIKPKLLGQLARKNSKDAMYQELRALADSSDEETTNIAAFLTLPYLIATNVVSAPTTKRKRSGIKEKKWKPTKVETRDSFITHITDDSYLKIAINKRCSSYSERGLTVQPYILMVGPTLFDIKSYSVVVNSEVLYSRTNIISAVDSCFKVIWALNLQYSADCYGVWYFIQKGLYEMTSPHDKGSTSAESLLTDCTYMH